MTTITLPRATVEQALEALIKGCNINATEWHQAIYALRSALAQQAEPAQEPVAWRWGYRSVTTGEMDWRGYVEIAAHPNLRSPEIIIEPLYTAPPQRKQAEPAQEPITRLFGTLPVHDTQQALAQQAEPVEPGAWVASKDGRVIYDDASTDDGLLRVSGDFKNDEQRVRYAQRIVDKLNAAAEMRRLHAENKLLHERHHDDNVEYTRVLEQRDALLKLLKLARSIIGHPDDAHTQMIDAAIKAVEEGK